MGPFKCYHNKVIITLIVITVRNQNDNINLIIHLTRKKYTFSLKINKFSPYKVNLTK